MIWFTADTHFNHKNIISICKRPYGTMEEMNESIINNWNSVVDKHDIGYIIGDFAFTKPVEFFNRLNGTVFIVPGNHDKNLNKIRNAYIDCTPNPILPIISELKLTFEHDAIDIVMCHYPMRSWNKSHYGSWHLFGHHHGNLPPHGLSFDVGVDTNNFYPYSLVDVSDKIRTLSREYVIPGFYDG